MTRYENYTSAQPDIWVTKTGREEWKLSCDGGCHKAYRSLRVLWITGTHFQLCARCFKKLRAAVAA